MTIAARTRMPSTGFEVIARDPARGMVHPIAGHTITPLSARQGFVMWSRGGPEFLQVSQTCELLLRGGYGMDITLYNDPGSGVLAENIDDDFLKVGDFEEDGTPYRALMMFDSPGASGTAIRVMLTIRAYNNGVVEIPTTSFPIEVWVSPGSTASGGFGAAPDIGDWGFDSSFTYAGTWMFVSKGSASQHTFTFNSAAKETVQSCIQLAREIHVGLKHADENAMGADKWFRFDSGDATYANSQPPVITIEYEEGVAYQEYGMPQVPGRSSTELMRP